jgi:predicted GNAT family N-acyltransferase
MGEMDAAEFSLRWAATRAEVLGALMVREQVFCREQGVPLEMEVDGRDQEALHLLASESPGERVVGTLRLLLGGEVAKVGRVAVERDWRRRGVAAQMLDVALARAREGGCSEARLASQLNATSLYERVGFTVESEPFEEAGIAHVWMGRRL